MIVCRNLKTQHGLLLVFMLLMVLLSSPMPVLAATLPNHSPRSSAPAALLKYRLLRVKTFFRDNSPAMTMEVLCEGTLQVPLLARPSTETFGSADQITFVDCPVEANHLPLNLRLSAEYSTSLQPDPFFGEMSAAKKFYHNLKLTNAQTGRPVGANDAQGTHWSYKSTAQIQSLAGALSLPLNKAETDLVLDRVLFSLDLLDLP
jgi:hypothetical protein